MHDFSSGTGATNPLPFRHIHILPDPRRIRREKIVNIILGVNIIIWAVFGIWKTEEPHLTLVRICIIGLHFLVGILILNRSVSFRANTRYETLICIPSFLSSGLLFHFSARLETWATLPVGIFVTGSFLTAIAFLFLGKGIGIRANFRQLAQRGPYRIVRHPVYLGEFLMGVACLISAPNIAAFASFGGLILFQLLRIQAEEKALQASSQFERYVQRTKWRLVPFVW